MRKNKKDTGKIIRSVFSRLTICLFFCLLIFSFYFLFQGIRKSCWDGEHNFNFIVQGDKTLVFSYHPEDEALNIISFPNKLYIETAKGYGEYRLEKITQLGEMEKIGAGELLKKSLQNYLGAPIDGYVISNKKTKLKINDESLEKGKTGSLLSAVLSGQAESSLGIWDLLRFFFQARKLKLNQLRLIEIENTVLFQKTKLADQSGVYKLDESLLLEFTPKYFTDKGFLNERLKISVYNATNYPGVAKNTGRMLKNIGGEILFSADAPEARDDSIIYYSKKELIESYTFNKIKQILEIEKAEFDPQAQGDIVIFLGKSFLECFYYQ